jgi:hypothetical protein
MRVAMLLAQIAFVFATAAMWAADSQTESRSHMTGAPAGRAYTRTTLYFGLARPAGTISERQWKVFVREEITTRFAQGFTIWEARGQWRSTDGRISREKAKILLLLHEHTAEVRDTLVGLVERYKRTFQQEPVLWETASVCAAF